MKSPRPAIFYSLLAPLALFLLYLPYYPVGYFGDDAMYLVAAQSLLQGRFAYLFMPRQPPINLFFQGYPALLAPFLILWGTHWAWYKAISVLFTLGFCLFTGLLFGLESASGMILLILVSLSPLIVVYSGTVMTDPAYTLFVMGDFLLLRTLYKKIDSQALALTLGFLLGWTCLIRPVGLGLVAAVTAGLFLQRSWKAAVRVSGVALTMWILAAARNIVLTHTTTMYWGQWNSDLQGLQRAARMIAALGEILRKLFGESLLGLSDFSGYSGIDIWNVAAVFGGLFLAVWGFRHFYHRKNGPKGFALSLGLFLVLHLAMHTSWVGFDYRFLLPVLPLVIMFVFEGVLAVVSNRTVRWGILAGVLCLYGRWHVRALRDVWGPDTPVRALPMESFQWVRDHTPSDAAFDMARPATLYLYTSRQATAPRSLFDPDLFRYWLLKAPISYVFYEDQSYVASMRSALWQQHESWLAQRPTIYPVVYSNEREKVRIYQVQPDPDFIRRYEAQMFSHPS